VVTVIRALRPRLSRILPALLLAVLLLLVLTGCETDTPQNTFDAKGRVAEDQRDIFYLAMWPAIVVMILVLGGILVAVLRFRERDPNARPPKQTHGNMSLELAWTIAPGVLLLILGVPMVAMIYDIGREPSEDAYYIDVTGQRYSWSFEYPEIEDDRGDPLAIFPGQTPHIPTGREVAFRLHSVDVIHSFWLPKLGGKLDVVPGETNTLWLITDEPGSYSGQCAEYCGLEHALMRLTVIADAPEDFEAWAEEAAAGGPGGGEPGPGGESPDEGEGPNGGS
jgi:cytochrome c oxidase subunit 2